MVDKVKILKINRKKNDESDLINAKKTFKLIEEPWYNESDTSVSIDFDETLELQEKVTLKSEAKITLVQNANSHFLKNNYSLDFDLKIGDIQQTRFDTIAIVSDQSNASKLPLEILKLRKESFVNEQNQKNKLLKKVNNTTNCDYHPQNHLLADLPTAPMDETTKHISLTPEENIDDNSKDFEKKINNFDMEENLKIIEEIKTTKHTENFESAKSSTIFETEKSFENSANDKTIENPESLGSLENLESHDISSEIEYSTKSIEVSETQKMPNLIEPKSKEELNKIEDIDMLEKERNKTMEKNNLNNEMLRKIEEQLSEVSDSIEAASSRKHITQTPHQLDSSILDYTVADQTDDMDREIAKRTQERQLNKTDDESEMTMMLNGIISSADKNQKIAKQIYAMENLGEWVNNPDELTKIKNLSKKEQKRLLKKMKGK